MNDSQAPKDPVERDLTSTIHLSALRSVPKPRPLEEIYTLLSGEEREIVSQLPKNSAMLIVIAGANRGARFLIDSDETSIGRDPKSDIFLDDVTVSRVHAKISRSAAGDFAVHDCESLNGSYLNAHQIKKSNLAVGDEIQIGKFRLTYFKGRAN
jgi:pSer/pThr/pTyr-binding forkhead associated (FHA) protein